MNGLLNNLRTLTPNRPLTRGEAVRVAELQANRLLGAMELIGPPVSEALIRQLPHIQVERLKPIPVSGSTHWAKGNWVIILNADEPRLRQRFSLAHELKHVLDGPFGDKLYSTHPNGLGKEFAEVVADHFAANLLMPRMWVKRAWRAGIQTVPGLAHLFDVSQAAMRVRLQAMGLIEPIERCRTAA